MWLQLRNADQQFTTYSVKRFKICYLKKENLFGDFSGNLDAVSRLQQKLSNLKDMGTNLTSNNKGNHFYLKFLFSCLIYLFIYSTSNKTR